MPDEKEMDWLSEKYPDTFDKYYRPRFEHWREKEQAGERFYNPTLPMLCNTCQIPMGFTEMDDPSLIAYRQSVYQGERYNFCSDGCKDIFDHEPEKYVQSWLPVHQIYQGNCGGADIEKVLSEYYRINMGKDNLDFHGSPDEARWNAWHNLESAEERLKKAG